jgi:predicted NBD/HSP70 family sugar kinase
MSWCDTPVIRLHYRPADDVLVARFLPPPAARRQYPHDRLCVEFDGDDEQALPTALAVTGFLNGARSPSDATLLELLGDLVWRRAVELSVSGETEREIDLSPAERDSRLTAWGRFVRRARVALGVEVVPGEVRAVLVDDRGDVLERWTRAVLGTSAWSVADAVGRLVDEASQARGGELVVGVGIGGPVDRETGVVHSYNKGDDPSPMVWENEPLGHLVAMCSGARVLVLNDVEALATYERWFGLRNTVDRYGVLLVEEGIGGALVVHGQIDTGMPAEFGNNIIHPGGRKCRCGDKGCVEATAGMWAIVERVREEADHYVTDLTAAVDLAERGDDPHSQLAERVFYTAGQDLAIGIGTVQSFANLKKWAIYVPPALRHGSVARGRFLEGLQEFKSRISFKPYRQCELTLVKATGEEGAQGAAVAALEHFMISSPQAARE